jgi:ethanolamine transporter
MLPIFVISLLIALGLAWFPRFMVKGFMVFSRILVAVITASLALAILKELTGITVVPGMAPLADSFIIIGKIAIVLAGAYPMVFLIGKAAKRPITWLACKMGTNEAAFTGFIAASANSIPMFSLIKEMDDKGKVLNFSFNCCAAYALGDHLGFSAGTEPDLIFPMVASKLAGGILCILTAQVLLKIQEGRKQRKAAQQEP